MLEITRPRQWYKNLIIFLPLIFSQSLFDVEFIFWNFLGFIILCIGTGGAYILNDYFDYKKDLIHPSKKNRPLPSGRMSKRYAIFLSLVLISISFISAYFISEWFFVSISLLILSIFLYSIKLKEIFLLDVFLISINYIFRAMSGAFIVNLDISNWLISGVFLLALLLSFSKRKNELLLLKDKSIDYKKVLKKYSHRFLNFAIAIISAGTLLTYVFYSLSGPKEINDLRLVLTIPIVVLILVLFSKKTIEGKYQGKELDEILIENKLLGILIVIYLIMLLGLINLFPDLKLL